MHFLCNGIAFLPSLSSYCCPLPRCPVRKKRLTEAELSAVADEWALGTHQGIEVHGVDTCPSGLSVPSMLDAVCEEMDQTTGEPQCDVARRRLQEIEDR